MASAQFMELKRLNDLLPSPALSIELPQLECLISFDISVVGLSPPQTTMKPLLLEQVQRELTPLRCPVITRFLVRYPFETTKLRF